MTLSKSGRFRAEASFQQPPPSSISSINLSYCSLSVASFIAAKHIALARAHHPRQPNPPSVCGSSLAQSTRGFVLWRLPDAGPGARRSISHGRHPKPCTNPDPRVAITLTDFHRASHATSSFIAPTIRTASGSTRPRTFTSRTGNLLISTPAAVATMSDTTS